MKILRGKMNFICCVLMIQVVLESKAKKHLSGEDVEIISILYQNNKVHIKI